MKKVCEKVDNDINLYHRNRRVEMYSPEPRFRNGCWRVYCRTPPDHQWYWINAEHLYIRTRVMDLPLVQSFTFRRVFGLAWEVDSQWRIRKLNDLERLALEAPGRIVN